MNKRLLENEPISKGVIELIKKTDAYHLSGASGGSYAQKQFLDGAILALTYPEIYQPSGLNRMIWRSVYISGYPKIGQLVLVIRDIEPNLPYPVIWSEEEVKWAKMNGIIYWMEFESPCKML